MSIRLAAGAVSQQSAGAPPPGTPATLVDWTVHTDFANPSITMAYPATVAAGLSCAIVVAQSNETIATPPPGFTLLTELTGFSAMHVWTLDGGTDGTEGGTTVDIVLTGNKQNASYLILVDGTLDVSTAIVNDPDPVPSMTASGSGLGIWLASTKDTSSPFGDVFPPAGITKIDSALAQFNQQRTGFGTKTVPAGATGTQLWTTDGGAMVSMGLVYSDPV